MESIIERNKDSYYLALRRTQQAIRKEEQNWDPWLVFFLKTMAKQKDNLAEKVKEEQALRASRPVLSRQILELVKARGEITVKEVEESTGASRNTIKARSPEYERAVQSMASGGSCSDRSHGPAAEPDRHAVHCSGTDRANNRPEASAATALPLF